LRDLPDLRAQPVPTGLLALPVPQEALVQREQRAVRVPADQRVRPDQPDLPGPQELAGRPDLRVRPEWQVRRGRRVEPEQPEQTAQTALPELRDRQALPARQELPAATVCRGR
jgi:hypothetical protein